MTVWKRLAHNTNRLTQCINIKVIKTPQRSMSSENKMTLMNICFGLDRMNWVISSMVWAKGLHLTAYKKWNNMKMT